MFGVDPLIERQAYRCRRRLRAGRFAASRVGFSDGGEYRGWLRSRYWYPRGKVRYPTVQQPNSLAFDDASDTLYVVSGSGAGVQVIRDAAGAR